MAVRDGDGEALRRYRERMYLPPPATSSVTYCTAYRCTGALEGRDQPLLATPFRPGARVGDRQQAPGATHAIADLGDGSPPPGAAEHRKGFRKPLGPAQEPGFTAICLESPEWGSQGIRGPGPGGGGLRGRAAGAHGGLDRQPRALLERRQTPRRTFSTPGEVLEGRGTGPQIAIRDSGGGGGSQGDA